MIRKYLIKISFVASLFFIFIGCNKTERSKSQATGSSSTDKISPSVFSVRPSDNSMNVGLKSSVEVSFNESMDNNSVTANLSDSSCAGTLQLSSDNFTTCVKMSGTPVTPVSSFSNYTFTVSPSDNLSENTLYKIPRRVFNQN